MSIQIAGFLTWFPSARGNAIARMMWNDWEETHTELVPGQPTARASSGGRSSSGAAVWRGRSVSKKLAILSRGYGNSSGFSMKRIAGSTAIKDEMRRGP